MSGLIGWLVGRPSTSAAAAASSSSEKETRSKSISLPRTYEYEIREQALGYAWSLLGPDTPDDHRSLSCDYLISMHQSGLEGASAVEFLLPQFCFHAATNDHARHLITRLSADSAHIALLVWSTLNAAIEVLPPNAKAVLEDIQKTACLSQGTRDQFTQQKSLLQELAALSETLAKVEPTQRKDLLTQGLGKINSEKLAHGTYWLPLGDTKEARQRIVRLVEEEARPFKTYARCPFIVPVEVVNAPDRVSRLERNLVNSVLMSKSNLVQILKSSQFHTPTSAAAAATTSVNSNNSSNTTSSKGPLTSPPLSVEPSLERTMTNDFVEVRTEEEDFFSGSSSALVEKRVKKTSRWSHDTNWHLISILVKSGDDLRQEQFCMQLISFMQIVFADAKLPLILRPYRILPFAANAGLIETVTDAITLHELKALLQGSAQGSNTSLLECFKAEYGEANSERFMNARNRFVCSMAACSVMCYLLQIKDRHNANIMLHRDGYVVHIDFGFCLATKVPVPIETAPFKLTQELIDVMGGLQSEGFVQYSELCVQGYLAIRREGHNLIRLIQMSVAGNLACLAAGGMLMRSTADEVKRKLHLEMDDKGAAEHMLMLISRARSSWTTAAHESFQSVFSGIHGV